MKPPEKFIAGRTYRTRDGNKGLVIYTERINSLGDRTMVVLLGLGLEPHCYETDGRLLGAAHRHPFDLLPDPEVIERWVNVYYHVRDKTFALGGPSQGFETEQQGIHHNACYGPIPGNMYIGTKKLKFEVD